MSEYVKQHDYLLALSLLAIGFALLYASDILKPIFQLYEIITNVGVTFIVTAVSIFILSKAMKGAEYIFEGRIDYLKRRIDESANRIKEKVRIVDEAEQSGIVRIFKTRRRDQSFKTELIKRFNEASRGDEILIMSISLRDFFGPTLDNDYFGAIIDALRRGVCFKILLLDPTSPAAQARAYIEERQVVENQGYAHSALFRAIVEVARRLDNPATLVRDENIAKRIKEQIKVKFYPYDPTCHLIITKCYTFVEQYHRGGDMEILEHLSNYYNIRYINCFGGFVPVFMVSNSSLFARLLRSHFYNIWNSNEVKSLDTIINEIRRMTKMTN